MFDTYLLEIDDVEAGILLRQEGGFVFHAVANRYRGFEGEVFSDPWSAERALRRLGRRRAGDPGPTRTPPSFNRARRAG